MVGQARRATLPIRRRIAISFLFALLPGLVVVGVRIQAAKAQQTSQPQQPMQPPQQVQPQQFQPQPQPQPSAQWATMQRMQLERQFAGPLQDTIVQRWRDPVDGSICYIYLPITAPHSPPTANGFVQYGASVIGSLSCLPGPEPGNGRPAAKKPPPASAPAR